MNCAPIAVVGFRHGGRDVCIRLSVADGRCERLSVGMYVYPDCVTLSSIRLRSRSLVKICLDEWLTGVKRVDRQILSVTPKPQCCNARCIHSRRREHNVKLTVRYCIGQGYSLLSARLGIERKPKHRVRDKQSLR
jgi:hypothetical protein